MRPLIRTLPGAALVLFHLSLAVLMGVQNLAAGALFTVVSVLILAPLYAKRVH